MNNDFISVVRQTLKEATILKKEKKYNEACKKLNEAYSADGSENLMIEDRLRLPMYLLLAGRNNEGWDELNRLLLKYKDPFSPPLILNQMKVFIRKENNEPGLKPIRIIPKGDENSSNNTVVSKEIKLWELQNNPIPNQLQGMFNRFEFEATLQFRTPLRVLLHHGEIYRKNDGKQPIIAIEPWEGFWVPRTKTYRELGLDIDEMNLDIVASMIGPIDSKEYVPFLIAIRKIVELNETIEYRIKNLREMSIEKGWDIYINKHGGISEIINIFFPKIIYMIPNINKNISDNLLELGLDTLNKISIATDSTLLNIKGIGPAKLKIIRDFCFKITVNRDSIRTDEVRK